MQRRLPRFVYLSGCGKYKHDGLPSVGRKWFFIARTINNCNYLIIFNYLLRVDQRYAAAPTSAEVGRVFFLTFFAT